MKAFSRLPVFLAVLLCAGGAFSIQSPAEYVDMEVLTPPPPLAINNPPMMAVIPTSPYVYFALDVHGDVFFCMGYWYRPHVGYWFRARSYRGPWKYIDRSVVSPVLLTLPHDYRKNMSPQYWKVHSGELRRSWRQWEEERYWDGREAK